MKNIQVFLDFANFYWHFIQNFNKIAKSLNSMLKINWSAKHLLFSIAEDGKSGSGSGSYKDDIVKKSLSKNLNRAIGYLTPNAKQAFT